MSDSLPGGYNGKILRVNLTSRRCSDEEVDAAFCRTYLGGAGFALFYMLRDLAPGLDALSPANILTFMLGPITGTSLSGASRHTVATKSPLTGGIVLSEAGEHWGAELKRAGYDGVLVDGRAAEPVYLWIRDGVAELRDAGRLWGQPTKETQQAIREELGDDKIKIASIGPAGENLVRYACIMHGLYDAAGRGGAGAVMGSKLLKAVAVRGRTMPSVADPQGLKDLAKWFAFNLSDLPTAPTIHEFGTGSGAAGNVASGNMPVHNFRDGEFPDPERLDAVTIKETVRTDMRGCFACVVRCKKVVAFEEPFPYDSSYGGPEYEALAALGSNCGVGDLKVVSKANELCNAYGIDTISAGATIAFAMECFENGLLSSQDTNGIDLRFGNESALMETLQAIVHREGIGDLLAEGTARAAARIGADATRFAAHVKGLEAGMHEPRLKPGLGLGFMVNPHGADHCCNLQDTLFSNPRLLAHYAPLGYGDPVPASEIGPGKVALFRTEQMIRILRDCMLMCWFCTWPAEKLVEIIKAVTGWHTGIMEQFRVAERVLTMARLFNIREGLSAADDVLPPRFFQPKTSGPLADKPLDPTVMQQAKEYYYVLMGWDRATGIPLPEKLGELGLTWLNAGAGEDTHDAANLGADTLRSAARD